MTFSNIRKAVVAVATMVVLTVVAATEGINLSDGIDGTEWVAIIFGALNFVGVYRVPNDTTPGRTDGET